MFWNLASPLFVVLSVILTLGCHSSAKRVQIEEFAKDADFMVALPALPEQPLGLERQMNPAPHSQFEISPEAGVDFKILAVAPNSGTDYKIAIATPAAGTDYKMLIVPEQAQSSRVIGAHELPPHPRLEVPRMPWKSMTPPVE